MKKVLSHFFIVISALVLCTGIACLNPFSPKLADNLEQGDLIITPQRNPDEVLQNFKVAYAFRDSLLYSDLLDTGFVFVYFDPNEGTSGQYVSMQRGMDLATTGRIFRHFDMIDLVWNTTLYETIDDESGEISRGFNLTLADETSDYRITGRAVFSFQKGLDDKWRISRWKDESDI